MIASTSSLSCRFRVIILLIVLILCVAILFSLNNGLYKLIGVILIGFAMSRRISYVVVIPIIAIILFIGTPLIDVISAIRSVNNAVYTNYIVYLNNVVNPDTGLAVLPDKNQQILKILQTYDISTYRLSESLQQDALIYQRTIESLWPRTFNESSPYIFIAASEVANYSTCAILQQDTEIILVNCN